MSLSALAAVAGIGKGSLSELEAGTRNPTLATLYAIAGPLRVPLAALLDDTIGAEVSGDGMDTRLLDVRHHDTGTVETYLLVLAPGATRRSPAHAPGATEHLVVTRGAFGAGPEDHVTTAGPGDRLDFAADRPHRYTAGPAGSEAVLVIRTPVGGPP